MRLTNRLYAQHIGWWFKKKWLSQGQRIPRDTGAKTELEQRGITVLDVQDVASPKQKFDQIEIVGYKPPQIVEDDTHPDWHNEVCHFFQDSNVLLEGMPQAQVLTKTIEIKELPRNIEESINNTQISSSIDKNIQNSILASHVFDAEQEKTAIVKIQERPAFVLPRNYGITDNRKNRLIISKLLFECEKLAGRSVTSQRKIVSDAKFIVSLEKDNDKLQFDVTAETYMTSKRPIEQVKGKYDLEIPDLYPVKHTVTMPKKNIYTLKNFYPIVNNVPFSHPHTIFLHYSPLDVKNLHETPVTETQFESRTLLKAFTVAAARAKQIYGDGITNLPQPVVVQSIQTDGRSFHFGVFQLNTLDINGVGGVKNYWFHVPKVDLFTKCGYKVGRPILDGYNKDVFRYINAFYCNC